MTEGIEPRPFSALSDHGVLWLINRVVFHPRGYALALHYEDGADEPSGWSLLGDGSEVWEFGGSHDEDAALRAVEALFAEARAT